MTKTELNFELEKRFNDLMDFVTTHGEAAGYSKQEVFVAVKQMAEAWETVTCSVLTGDEEEPIVCDDCGEEVCRVNSLGMCASCMP